MYILRLLGKMAVFFKIYYSVGSSLSLPQRAHIWSGCWGRATHGTWSPGPQWQLDCQPGSFLPFIPPPPCILSSTALTSQSDTTFSPSHRGSWVQFTHTHTIRQGTRYKAVGSTQECVCMGGEGSVQCQIKNCMLSRTQDKGSKLWGKGWGRERRPGRAPLLMVWWRTEASN